MTDDLTNPKTMSGYELALRVLNHSSGGIEALLELSGSDESDWLELKAGMELLQEDVEKGFKPDDLYWNIATAVLEIMNTSGGVLIIGIENKTHKVIPLRKNDSRHIIEQHGMEAYRRIAILERIWPSGVKKWSQPKENKTWRIKDVVPENLLEPRGVQYQGEEIAVILIKPALPSIRIWKNEEVEQIRARKLGEIGGLLEIKGGRRMDLYDKNRCINNESYAALYRKFLDKVEPELKVRLNEKIEIYYKRFEEVLKKEKVFGLSCFTSLDALGEISAEESEDVFMEPQVIELISEDDNWYNVNDDADFREHDFDGEEDDVGGTDDELIADEEEKAACYREKRSGDLLELMRDIPRIAVLGEPGGGKTTTLKRFTMQFHQPESKEQILAVFIPMGLWGKSGRLESMIGMMTGLNPFEWQKLIETHRLRLVIDAVNECPDDYRKGAILSIQSFLREYPELPVVISARTYKDLKDLHLQAIFTVQPMDVDHQLKYLTTYLKDANEAQSLQKRLLEMSGGMEIAANPMLLFLVVDVFRIEGKLPAGRADLYRRWIDYWYKRERDKAKKAGEPLHWNFDRALEALSELAFQSRLRGYRDVPQENVKSILERFGKDCIAKLCQGPVVTAEEDFIRFRHETFQEYLCAEYLIRHPDALPTLTRADSAQWGMPLAYAAELCWPLPESLWRAAWEIDPWFGLAVTDDIQLKQKEHFFSEIKNPFLSFVVSKFVYDKRVYLSHKSRTMMDSFGYSNADQKMAYAVLTKEEIRQRWFRIELDLLRRVNASRNICYILSHSIVLKLCAGRSLHQTFLNILNAGRKYISPSFARQINCFEDTILSEESLRNVTCLIKDGFASKEDFKNRVAKWFQDANLVDAECMIDAGLASKDDFKDRIDSWILRAEPGTAIRLIQNEWATKDDFKERVAKWISEANPQTAKLLIQYGFASKEDFREKIAKWILESDPKTANLLILYGIASKESFISRIETWKKGFNPQTAKQLVYYGFASKEDFREKIVKWLLKDNRQLANRLIQEGFTLRDDFESRIKEQFFLNNPKKAILLIHNGFVSKDGLNEIVKKWILEADTEIAIDLIKNGLASKKKFKNKVNDWISVADPKTAKHLIQLGFASKSDFKNRIDYWVSEADPNAAVLLIQLGFASKSDFKDKICYWISHADPKMAIQLIQNGLATKDVFKNKIKKWIKNANPRTAKILIQNGFAAKNDFEEKIRKWILEASPQTAKLLIQLGFASKEDFKDIAKNREPENRTHLKKHVIKKQKSSPIFLYSESSLAELLERQTIQRDLRGKKWNMGIVSSGDTFSFLAGAPFHEPVFCMNYLLSGGLITIGSIWSVEVSIQYVKKKNRFCFYVKSAEFVSSGE